MATKVYAIFGYAVAPIRIPAGDGRAFIECEFTRGCVAKGPNYRPATYATNDKFEQDIIEDSQYFKTGFIKLHKVYGTAPSTAQEASAPAVKAAESENAPEPKIFEDVTSYEQAITTLKSLGAKATQLRSTETIRKFMASKSVTFPNYSFED